MKSKHSTKIEAAKLRAQQLGAKHGATTKRGASAVKAVVVGVGVSVAGYAQAFWNTVAR